MEQNKTFTFNYSAVQNQEIQEIRKKYLPKEESKLEELKRLDNKVQKAGVMESLIIGITGCLVFGVGFCLVMQVIGNSIPLGVVIGIIGAAIMIVAYPVYRRVYNKTRQKLAPRILELTEEVI